MNGKGFGVRQLHGVVLALGVGLLATGAASGAEQAYDEMVDSLHERAVLLARQEKYAESIKILKAILEKEPRNYSVRRDYVVIATWMGNCDLALKQYEFIRWNRNKEPYLAVPVAECMEKQGDKEGAVRLLAEVNRRSGDKESQDALRRVKRQFALDQRPVLDVAAETSKSDAGAREWLFSARLKTRIDAQWQWYLRFLHAQASDPAFDTGDFNRFGGGVIYGINQQLTLIEDLAAEIAGFDDLGSTTTLVYTPTLLLSGQLEFATFAEDVPLRARAVGVDAKRLSASVDHHTHDYRWESAASLTHHDFSDGNNRWAFNGSVGYAFELAEKREQRLIGGVSQSTNSRSDVVYFSPERDLSLTMTYKLDLVMDTRALRRVDHYYAWVGSYAQSGERTSAIYGVRYEQDYDLDELTSLTWGAAWRSSVYDGNRETETNLIVSVSRKL